jgi:hypothetical protein
VQQHDDDGRGGVRDAEEVRERACGSMARAARLGAVDEEEDDDITFISLGPKGEKGRESLVLKDSKTHELGVKRGEALELAAAAAWGRYTRLRSPKWADQMWAIEAERRRCQSRPTSAQQTVRKSGRGARARRRRAARDPRRRREGTGLQGRRAGRPMQWRRRRARASL